MASQKIIQSDCLDGLRTLADGSVHCCVTSPPYWGLRDYGHDGQIGLEATPEAYVARMVEVFREVRRVLREDGTLWLNLGDCYASAPKGNKTYCYGSCFKGRNMTGVLTSGKMDKSSASGLAHKQLVGIPWRVAFALQQPYYTGKVAEERDRVWFAAMLDGEGSICGTEYQTGDRTKTNIYITITNTSVPIIDKCERLFPQEIKHVYEKTNSVSNRRCFRWDVERMETKSLFLREIYPYLVAKRKQAIVGYTFTELQRGLLSKKKGYLPEQQEQRSWLMDTLSKLNSGEDVDLPNWCIEPPPLFEPGFYLRQDIIWHKPNPMPESVRDRCTKAHEYVFLLTKSGKYFYDAEAVSEESVTAADGRGSTEERKALGHPSRYGDTAGKASRGEGWSMPSLSPKAFGRNRRSVWKIATKSYRGAHFATMPPQLAETCLRAGTSEAGCCSLCGTPHERVVDRKRVATRPGTDTKVTGDKMTDGNRDPERHVTTTTTTGWRPTCSCNASVSPCTVLDPFGGSGTTLAVAAELGLNGIGFELNPEYIDLANERINKSRQRVPLFS
jgi:DNA modification methylase